MRHLLLCVILAAISAPAQAVPNIVFIISDDQSPATVSAYGTTVGNIRTTNIDRIAAAGVKFTHAFAVNPVCGPSRASFWTGKYSHMNGTFDNGSVGANDFNASQQTLQKLLHAAGYQTAIFGKWHFETRPTAGTGWDYWKVGSTSQTFYDNPSWDINGVVTQETGYVTDLNAESAIAWMDARNTAAPFFVVISQKAPHDPFVPRPGDESLFTTDIAHPPTFDERTLSSRALPAQGRGVFLRPALLNTWQQAVWVAARPTGHGKNSMPGGLTEAQKDDWIFQQYVKDYLRCVQSLDDSVGEVLDYLNAESCSPSCSGSLASNTLVIFTSDNGMLLGDYFAQSKLRPEEPSIRIPLLMQFPTGGSDAIAAGTTDAHFATTVDIAPTILAYAGVSIPTDMQGASLEDLVDGSVPTTWRESVYIHTYQEGASATATVPYYALRTSRYKLIRYYGQRWGGQPAWELLDLEADPDELTNVYDDAQYASVVQQLKAEIGDWQDVLGIGRTIPECVGDMNGDGVIAWPDVFAVHTCIGSLAEGGCLAADFDGNGSVTIFDYLSTAQAFGQTCAQ